MSPSKSDEAMADCADATAPEPVSAAAAAKPKPKRGSGGSNKRTASERVTATAAAADKSGEKPARRAKKAGDLAYYQVSVPSAAPWNVLAIVCARDLDGARDAMVYHAEIEVESRAEIWAEKLALSAEGVHPVGFGQSLYQPPGSTAGLHLFYAYGYEHDSDGEPGVAAVIATDDAAAHRMVMNDLSARQKAPLDLRIEAIPLAEDTFFLLNTGYPAA